MVTMEQRRVHNMLVTCIVYIGYCTVARRYEFYDRVARTIYFLLIVLATRTKVRVFELTCYVLFII